MGVKQPTVGIIVLNHNGKELAAACLASVAVSSYPHKAIILVDNASTDGSVAYLKARFPDVTIVANRENLTR